MAILSERGFRPHPPGRSRRPRHMRVPETSGAGTISRPVLSDGLPDVAVLQGGVAEYKRQRRIIVPVAAAVPSRQACIDHIFDPVDGAGLVRPQAGTFVFRIPLVHVHTPAGLTPTVYRFVAARLTSAPQVRGHRQAHCRSPGLRGSSGAASCCSDRTDPASTRHALRPRCVHRPSGTPRMAGWPPGLRPHSILRFPSSVKCLREGRCLHHAHASLWPLEQAFAHSGPMAHPCPSALPQGRCRVHTRDRLPHRGAYQ